ncbi:MAG: sulfatase-like hydrolase/transferase [Opitutales bacterium]|jgi:hypothetical protein
MRDIKAVPSYNYPTQARRAELKNDQTFSFPNIVIVLKDDPGKDCISCYGYVGINSPIIDALAKEGIKLHNAYSMAACISFEQRCPSPIPAPCCELLTQKVNRLAT